MTTTQCGPDLTQKCPVANKSGVIYTKTDCDNANPTQDVVYNGADGTNGTNGTNGVGVCDGIASADLNKTVKNTTSVYTVATSSAEGYSTNTRTMCDETTVKTDIVQDTCTQIVDTRTSGACDGAYLMCTNQTTNATYYVCKAISGTNVSSISSAISTAQSTADNAAQTAADKVDTSTFTTYQSTVAGALANKANSSDLTTANNKITALETTVGDSTSGLVKQVAANTNDLSNKLDSSTAASTYLSQTNAASTYLTQTNAASTYATQTDLSSVDATARQAASDASSAVGTANTASRDASTALNNTQTLNTTVYGAADGTETANGLTTIVGKTANSGLRGTVASNTSNITSLQTRADNLETVVNGDGMAANQGLVEDLRALKSNYATLSSAYTDLQNRVAAMETCSTCSSGSGVQPPN